MSIKNPTNSLTGDTSDLNRTREGRLRFGFVDQSSQCLKQGVDGIFRIEKSEYSLSVGHRKNSFILAFLGFGPSYQISRKLARQSVLSRVTKIHTLDLTVVLGFIAMAYLAANSNYTPHISKQVTFIKSTTTQAVATKIAAISAYATLNPAKQHFDLHSFPGWMTPGPVIPRPYPSPLNITNLAVASPEVQSQANGAITSSNKFDSGKTNEKSVGVEHKKTVTAEEAVTVDLGVAKEIAATKSSSSISAGTPEAETWVAVTTNEGQLVMRKQGAFRQISVKERMPNGEILLSLNEASGEYRTSQGKYQIKGSGQ